MGLFLATRSFVLEAIARPQITATVGGDIEIGRVRWVGWARLEITDLSVRAPGWSGPSGEVLRIDRALINLDSAALRRGSFEIDTAEVDGMLVRLAEDASDPGRFSILSLEPGLGEGGKPPDRIMVTDFELQMGNDTDGTWERTGSLGLAGELIAIPGKLRMFEFEFVTKKTEEEPGQSVLKGELDTGSLAFNASIDDLMVQSNLLGMMPMELRSTAQAMELQGHIDRIETAWDGERDLYASITLAEAEMMIPDIDDEIDWSRLDEGAVSPTNTPPIMEVQSGLLTLENDRITLEDFKGRLRSEDPDIDEIPVTLDFEMDLAPVVEQRLDWSRSREIASQVFGVAPFAMLLTVPDFEIRSDGAGVILPTPAARTISQFGVEEWLLDIEVDIVRDPPTTDESGAFIPGQAITTGKVRVENGKGRYSRFPYPLENVRAHIDFDDEAVYIRSLVGNGPNGGTISATGSIIDPGPAAEIKVNLHGSQVPADNVFRDSLHSWRLRTWDRFFDRHAEARLREAGVLPDQEDVDRAKRERGEVLRQLAGDELDEGDRTALLGRSKRLKRIIDAGPFVLGGMFDFDLLVSSEAGVGKPVDLTGTITILEGDVLLNDFPFPTHVLTSTITLEPDMIRLGDGIQFTTPDGGNGLIRGSIKTETSTENDTASIQPDISFAAIDVSITPALLAALPPGEEDAPEDPLDWPGRWHSEAAVALKALGIKGQVDLEGTWLATEENEDPELSFDARLEDGSITPNLSMQEFFVRAGFEWPEGFILDDCSAKIHLDSTITRMTDFSGHRRGGVVTADGYISRTGNEQALHVAFRNIELEAYLLDLVSEDVEEEARTLWDRFDPRGRFDADLDWSRDALDETRSLVVARPGKLTLDMDGTDVDIETRNGEFRITPERLEGRDMILSLDTPEFHHGMALIDWTSERGPGEETLSIAGGVEGGRFESPVIPVLLDLFGARRVQASWLEMQPSGGFEATYEYFDSETVESDYLVEITPEDIEATITEDRISARIKDGTVRIQPGLVSLDGIVAAIPAPGEIDIDGTVTIGERISLDLAMNYELERLPEGSSDYFTTPLSTGFKAVDFNSEGPLRVSNGLIRGVWKQDASINDPELYEFKADLSFEDARFTAGPEFDHFDGGTRLELVARMDPERKLRSELSAPIIGTGIDVEGRKVTEPRANILIEGDDRLLIKDISGDIAGGRTVAEVEIDMALGTWELELDLEDASLQELTRVRDDEPVDGTIGRVLGNVRLFGILDDPESKRGRGRLIVVDGQMTNSPLTLSIVQLSQLMLPVSDSLEFGEVGFTVDGDRMVFDEFQLSSPSLQLDGEGEMSMTDWQLALRLSPRGTVPILSDLIGGVTSTFFAIDIGGTLGAPEARLEALPLFGGPARIDSPAPGDSTPETEGTTEPPDGGPG